MTPEIKDPRFTSSGRIEIVRMNPIRWHILEVSVVVLCVVLYFADKMVK